MLVIYPGKAQASRFIFLVETTKERKKSTYSLLEKKLNLIPTFMRLPSYSGIPIPVMFLRRGSNQTQGEFLYCAAGLWRQIVLICEKEGIQTDLSHLSPEWKYSAYSESLEQLRKRVSGWSLNINPRDYQLRAAWLILKYRLSLSELATRAGKTLIFYIVSRACLELGLAHRILMIVPSLHLVRQGIKDLSSYGDYFRLGQVCAGQDSVESDNLIIGTFQSLVKRPTEYFQSIDLVCVDEAHRTPSVSISRILEMIGDKTRFGFTGSLPHEGTIESFACQALLGPCIQQIRAEDLIEQGYLATPKIINYTIEYTKSLPLELVLRRCGIYLCSTPILDSNKKPIRLEKPELTIEYKRQTPLSLRNNPSLPEILSQCKSNMQLLNLEIMAAERSSQHLRCIENIIEKTSGNIIVFAHHTSYIRFLAQALKTDRTVHIITGSVPVKKREQILRTCENSSNNLIIGSYGCISTGITFRNIQAGILAQSFKSEILNKQALGRLMLRQTDKEFFWLYDIIDILPELRTSENQPVFGKSSKLLSQARERKSLWTREGYETQDEHYTEAKKIYLEEDTLSYDYGHRTGADCGIYKYEETLCPEYGIVRGL